MKQPYFIVVLAHSIHGRIRRIQIPHHAVYLVLALALVGCFSLFGFVSSYARMVWKVANYNALRNEVDSLRARYANLQSSADETKSQLATLQMFASEVSLAYGIKQKLEGPAEISGEGRLVPTYNETLSEYYFLKGASLSRAYRHGSGLWRHTDTRPNLWPVMGRLLGGFGTRNDPFSGEPSFHTGVDISAPIGTPVHAAADGTIVHAEWSGAYGRLVVIRHGDFQTYYSHLSRIGVVEGQEIRRGEIIGATGATGRVTSPHLHYEVRRGGQPLNPSTFLSRSFVAQSAKRDFPF
jgi:murein DD-endopeptidase MepM/ murein hydrolase activator NlpD